MCYTEIVLKITQKEINNLNKKMTKMTSKMTKKKIYTGILAAGIAALSAVVILANKPTETDAEVSELPVTTELVTTATTSTTETTTSTTTAPTTEEVRATEPKVEEKAQAEVKTVKPRTLTIKGMEISYEAEIGQVGINANHNIATTWGGDFNPNGHTLIAGHDDGPMGVIKQLTDGDIVTVTDSEGNEYRYRFQESRVVRMIYSGRGTGYVESQADGDYITSQFNSNNLNLQTCVETRADGYSIVFATLTKI